MDCRAIPATTIGISRYRHRPVRRYHVVFCTASRYLVVFLPVRRYRGSAPGTHVDGQVRRLKSILAELHHKHIDLLKLDIESGECDVIADVLASGIHPRQLAIGFHHAYRSIHLQRTINAVNELRRHDHLLFHILPRTYEMSFVYRSVSA